MTTRIIVIDDAPIVREAVVDLLTTDAAFEVVGVAGDADAAVTLAESHRPDIAIVDVRMPGGGPAATEAIRRVSPGTQVVAYSAHEDREQVLAMVQAGAVAYLSKDLPGRDVLEAIDAVRAGQPRFSATTATTVLDELGTRLRVEQTWADWDRARQQRVARVLAQPELLSTALQPVIGLGDRRHVGDEALARFAPDDDGQVRTPDLWFADAWDAGYGVGLEVLAVRRALRFAPDPGSWLSVNVSPETAEDDQVAELVAPVADRVVLELTEHTVIDDYGPLLRRLEELRALGLRVAVDDVGAGFASMRHVISLRPDIIKLDASLTWGVEDDPAQRTLTHGLVRFAAAMGAKVVAEGIETERQLEIMTELGVDYGQGYLLGRPTVTAAAPAPAVLVGRLGDG